MLKSKLFISMMIIVLTVSTIGGITMAWFTDQDTAGTATFTAGTLHINATDGLTTFNELLNTKRGNMNPGDVYEPIVIEIQNTGTKNLAWFGNWTFTVLNNENIPVMSDKLLDGMYIDSMKMEFLSPSPNADWEPVDQFITAGIGSGAYPAWFNTLASQGTFPVLSLREFDGNNGMGTTPYEHMGALKPGYSYRLTVQFGFYSGVDNTYQGDVANPIQIGFEVSAHQIKVDALNNFVAGFGIHEPWLMDQIAKQIY